MADDLAGIVERLRSRYVMHAGKPFFSSKHTVLRAADVHDAADAIEALQRDREMLIAFAAYVAQRDDSLGDDARAVLSHLKENDR